jgi:hypothetical protein
VILLRCFAAVSFLSIWIDTLIMSTIPCSII